MEGANRSQPGFTECVLGRVWFICMGGRVSVYLTAVCVCEQGVGL